jgi:hypothetical protein
MRRIAIDSIDIALSIREPARIRSRRIVHLCQRELTERGRRFFSCLLLSCSPMRALEITQRFNSALNDGEQ